MAPRQAYSLLDGVQNSKEVSSFEILEITEKTATSLVASTLSFPSVIDIQVGLRILPHFPGVHQGWNDDAHGGGLFPHVQSLIHALTEQFPV